MFVGIEPWSRRHNTVPLYHYAMTTQCKIHENQLRNKTPNALQNCNKS